MSLLNSHLVSNRSLALIFMKIDGTYLVSANGPLIDNKIVTCCVSDEREYAERMFALLVQNFEAGNFPPSLKSYKLTDDGDVRSTTDVVLQTAAFANSIVVPASKITLDEVGKLYDCLRPYWEYHPVMSMLLAVQGANEAQFRESYCKTLVGFLREKSISNSGDEKFIVDLISSDTLYIGEGNAPFMWEADNQIKVLNPDFYVGTVSAAHRAVFEWATS